ncbi:MAG TPA: hypothetical protein VHK28_09545, partial [Candidatus Limnocylindria bacterium]|nr:hypothetical protein [Candidatus Limnocylindria bacterium]
MTHAPETMTRDSAWRRGASSLGLPRDGVQLVIALIIAGVLLRVLVGGVLLPFSGFRIDVVDFASWAQRLVAVGPGAFYDPGYFSDYPPGYLYVLWLLGSIGQALTGLTAGVDITPSLVKIPGVLADAGVAWMLFVYSRRFLGGRIGGWSGERIGLVAAAVYICNPGTIFDSAVWGQVDSVGALVLLASLYWLARGWTEMAAVGAVVAMLVKFQFAFLIPIVAIVGLKRHLLGRSADPELGGRPDQLRVLTSLAAGLGTLVLLTLPFNMPIWAPGEGSLSLISKFIEATNTYDGLTINGFNLWRNPWSGLGDTLAWGCDRPTEGCTAGAGVAFMIGSTIVSWQTIGSLLFALAAGLALWHVARRDEPVGVLQGALLLAVAFFAVPTRVHERYLFPALALAAPLIAQRWRAFAGRPAWIAAALGATVAVLIFVVRPGDPLPADALPGAVLGQLAVVAVAAGIPLAMAAWGGGALYALLSISFFANVYWVYTADWSFAGGSPMNPGVGGEPMARDPFLAATVFSTWGIFAISFGIVAVLGVLAWRYAREAWVAQPDYATEPMEAREEAPPAAPPVAAQPAEPADRSPSPWQRLGRWMRPDPTDPYLREPYRRLDRLDLAIVLGLVVVALLFRLWRLDTPRSMHFDEVYHARSATEWLADWQEGWTRDTYEWTHPMLAKYLIAAGIVVADPNKVVDSVQTDAPATAMAISPQRTAHLRPASILFTATGDTTLTARELPSGEVLAEWEAPDPVASLAYDEQNERLLVGSAQDGTVTSYLLAAFTTAGGERAPPVQGTPIESGLASVEQIVIPQEAALILFRGADGIVAVERVTAAELARSQLVASDIGYLAGADDAVRVVAMDPARNALVALDGATLEPITEVVDGEDVDLVRELPSTPAGVLQVRGRGDDAQVYVPVGQLDASVEHQEVAGGISVFDDTLELIGTAPLPGEPSLIGWQPVANIIYVAGHDSSADQPAVWTIQPIGNGGRQSAGFAAFDTSLLPGDPLAMA